MIVDDEDDLRHLIRVTLEMTGEIDVVCEAADVQQGSDCWSRHRPDVLVLDYRLPGESGLDLAEWILQQDPDASIVLFSAYIDDEGERRARQLGVRAQLDKDRLKDLPTVVAAVARGGVRSDREPR
jgi:DNA-binding NarL/FixJ family response regulator